MFADTSRARVQVGSIPETAGIEPEATHPARECKLGAAGKSELTWQIGHIPRESASWEIRWCKRALGRWRHIPRESASWEYGTGRSSPTVTGHIPRESASWETNIFAQQIAANGHIPRESASWENLSIEEIWAML